MSEQSPITSAMDQAAVTAIRVLAMDAVQKANSGHPGTPVALAPVTYAIWNRFLRYDPLQPLWPNRDRYVLSCGHASMLLYSMIHLSRIRNLDHNGKVLDEVSLPLDQIKKFRQLDSRTPGHPEYHHTAGVETTTGPLGNGAGNSVGMAIAGKWLAARYNKPGFDLFTYRVYTQVSDGCLMEGVASEAASLAAHLKLDNLVWVYDNNHITIEGETSLAFSENVGGRFEAYGWHVLHIPDANCLEAITQRLTDAAATKSMPTLVVLNSRIAWGVPGKENHHSAHGEPLGAVAIEGAKVNYGVDPKLQFSVPPEAYEAFQLGMAAKGATESGKWAALFSSYAKSYPELAKEIDQMNSRQLPEKWDAGLTEFPWGEFDDPKNPGKKKVAAVASRDAGGKVLNSLAKNIPWLIGGSADLAPSTKTRLTFEGAGDFEAVSYGGRNLHFGIREHAMGAIINGMALCNLLPYGSGFLIFSDYGRGALRLGSLMNIPAMYVFTHDSIGVGEDGPTHQPIEHLASLRAIPGMLLLRPADANEVSEAYRAALLHNHSPSCIILTRQELTTFDRTVCAPATGLHQGAYVLLDAASGKPDVILIGTGSEVELCVSAKKILDAKGIQTRVVSMPSWELFEAYCGKNPDYRESVLPNAVRARVAVEMASPFGWERYTGLDGAILAMRGFGASGPFKDLLKKFNFTLENLVGLASAQVAGKLPLSR
ncbi:MAG: transketolase [Gemmataceae bacterium]|nr:transketolase [Gemmataceae bacterium]